MIVNTFLKIILLIFIFQSWTMAEDIRDFEIEGMSVGDNLNNYFNKNKIIDQKQKNQYPGSNKFTITTLYEDSFKLYESVSVSFKTKNTFMIHSLEGRLFFEKNFSKCLIKMDEISKNIENSLNSKDFDKQEYSKNHSFDKSGNSKLKAIAFWFKSGGYIQVTCTDWSNKIEKEKYFKDELKVSIADEEFYNFLVNEAYK